MRYGILIAAALAATPAFGQTSRQINSGDIITALGFTPLSGTLVPGNVNVGNSASTVKDSLSYGANGGLALSGGGTPSYNSCYWNDVDSCTTENVRVRERVLVGNAVLANDNRTNCCTNTWTLGLNLNDQWQVRDAQLAVLTDRGTVAITGMSQSSQSDPLGATTSPIGVASFVLNDTTVVNKNAWGMYTEITHNPTQPVFSFGMEIDSRNASATNATADPYSVGSGAVDLWLAAGAGTGAVNPSNAAVVVTANGQTFNEGIIFKDGSLTKDGSNNSIAVAMGQRAQLLWYIAATQVGATIRSEVNTNGNAMQLVFQNQKVVLSSASGNSILTALHTGTAVNGFQIGDSTTGTAPTLQVTGTDNNIGILFAAKGTGTIAVGTGSNVVSLPAVTTGTPVASLCLDGTNNIIKKTTTGPCV